ncbi:MAG: AgmX/PglI C-terminal domain-containing protein [Bdellovibrionales bacterium]|nr:AgmX/PglI C-terminal domain-containing protein [Bdellovibrionales bacterium]
MRSVELELEHSYKNRYVGKHRLKPTSDVTTLGSCRDASIRLLGDNVAGIHAVVEYTDQGWLILDMGSDHGTWMKKKPIVEQKLQGVTFINIGGHSLKLTIKEINKDLFTTSKHSGEKATGDQLFHQVIVRKQGFVVESLLLGQSEDYNLAIGQNQQTLTVPAQAYQWKTTEVGDVVVQQRLVHSTNMELSTREKFKGLVDPSLRAPLGAAAALVLLLFALIMFSPKDPDAEMKEIKPDTNKYTRMIYDAKKIKRSKKKSIKVSKNIKGTSKAATKKTAATGTRKQAKAAASKQAAKVVSKIKAAGLGALIGKISKRAAKSAKFVVAQGRSPDSTTGKALSSVGSPTLGKASGKAAYKGARVSGVKTAGKGGGSSAYKGIGGLSLGNVGNASVGILEEETEVQGGLEREVIARYIQSQLGQIRYCYERQLSASPDLYGKVKVKFTIGSEGSVVSQRVKRTSLKNAMVEGCILRRIASWRFPKPQGGTTVNVSYPFLFKSTR